jgi:hypothetical protein
LPFDFSFASSLRIKASVKCMTVLVEARHVLPKFLRFFADDRQDAS